MKVRYYGSKKWKKEQSLLKAMGISYRESPVISVVGAGGKTTTIERLAEEFMAQDRKVVVTTTTHIRRDAKPWYLLEPTVEELEMGLEEYRRVYVGRKAPDGKMGSLSETLLAEILKRRFPILIEADGAKGMSLKAPASQEPVILPESTHVLSVYGMDAVGKRMENVCFRVEAVKHILEKEEKDKITPEDVAILADSPLGGRKGCPAGAEYWVVLNQAEDIRRFGFAKQVCMSLEEKSMINVLVTGRGE